jgi:hypothetical protein
MRVDIASMPGDPAVLNEDFCGVAIPSIGVGGAAVVLDGVTAPSTSDFGCAHGTAWFTNRLGAGLLQAVGRRDAALPDCLAEILSRTAELHSDSCDLGHKRTPQATLAAVRWGPEWLDYLVLGDCELLVADRNGATHAIRDTRIEDVNRLDEKRKRRERLAQLPPNSREWAAARLAYQEYTDKFRNAPGGFYTAAADPSVAGEAVHGRLDVTDVPSMALVTDGLVRWIDGRRRADRAELLRVLARHGGRYVIDEVRQLERRGREAVGGGKVHDDATSIYIEL